MTFKALQASATSIKAYLFLINVLNIFKKRSNAARRKNVRERVLSRCLYFVQCDSCEIGLIGSCSSRHYTIKVSRDKT